MRKIILIISCSLLLLFTAMIYVSTKNYALLDIDADNYFNQLRADDGPIAKINIDHCIFERLKIFTAYDYASQQIGSMEIVRQEGENGRVFVQMWNRADGNYYGLIYAQNKSLVSCMIMNNFLNRDSLKVIADRFVLTEGFILKRSELIYGSDIIIKELPNQFIIGEIRGKYDTPGLIDLKSYSKKEYHFW